MKARGCDRIRDQLQLFLDGELAEAAQEEVQAHLEECPACRQELQQLAQVISVLDETIAPQPGPPGWTAAVLQAVREYGPLTGWRGRLRRWTRGDWLRLYLETAVAALLCWLWVGHPWNPTISPLELEIVNLQQWLCGSTAAVRIWARNTETRQPLRNARISLWLVGEHGRHTLYIGRTNERGTIDAYFRIPDRFQAGEYRLAVEIRAPQGQERLEQPIRLIRAYHLWLTTDRPAYPPGQTVRFCIWAYDRGTQRPAAHQKVRLEAEDPRGNLIWQTEQRINAYGVATAECALDRAALQGRYTVRASMSPTVVERAIWIGEEASPKFQVQLSPTRSFYAPGEVMEGRIEAWYPSGLPVRRGTARVAVLQPGREARPWGSWKGLTDDRGLAYWRLRLPPSLLASRGGPAPRSLRLLATVQDATAQTQTVQHSIPVASSPLWLEVVPESGTLVPDVENILYLVARSPDGNPCEVEWEVFPAGRRGPKAGPLSTAGVAEYLLRPGQDSLTLVARDRAGRRAVLKWSSKDVPRAAHPFLLRTDRAFYQAGDTVHVTVLTPRAGAVYLDVWQADQAVLTESLDVSAGRGTLAFDLPPEVSGILTLQAYSLGPQVWRDSAFIYVVPARQLRVALAPEFQKDDPSQEATLRLTVTGPEGEPIAAALGLMLREEDTPPRQTDSLLLFPSLFPLAAEPLGPGISPALVDAWVQAGLPAAPPPMPQQQRLGRALFARQSPPPGSLLHRRNNAQSKIERAQRVQREFLRSLRRYGLAAGICGGGALLWWLGKRLFWFLEPWLYRWRVKKPTPARGLRRSWGWALAGLSAALGIGWLLVQRTGGFGNSRPSQSSSVQLAHWEAAARSFVPSTRPPAPRRSDEAPVSPQKASTAPQGHPSQPSPFPRKPEAPDTMAGGLAFPATRWVQPVFITDEEGQARVQVPLNAARAPWQITAWASSSAGELGVGRAVLSGVRDFKFDMDLPSTLTQSDEIALPVTLSNFRDQPQKIHLTVKLSEKPPLSTVRGAAKRLQEMLRQPHFNWLTNGLLPPPLAAPPRFSSFGCTFLEEPTRAVTMAPREVRIEYFRLRAERAGTYGVKVVAHSAAAPEVVEREVVVQPQGRVFTKAFNGRLSGTVTRTLILPSQQGGRASWVRVKIYPGILSQAWEDLAALRPPPAANCEQVASAIQVGACFLKVLNRSPALTPPRRAHLERELHLGYQKLLAFEKEDAADHPTGGFGWSEAGPPQPWLTALSLQALTTLSAHRTVDPAVLGRLRHWLLQQQEPEGSWRAEANPTPGGRSESQRRLAATAYVAAVLAADSPEAPAVRKALRYLQDHWAQAEDAYSLALCALALGSADPTSPAARQARQRLVNRRRSKGNQVFWTASKPTLTYARGATADLETSALALLALLQAETPPKVIEEAWNYLLNQRQPEGGWGTSQATGLCLRVLLEAFESHLSTTAFGRVTVRVGTSKEQTLWLSRRERIAFQEVDVSPHIASGSNALQLSFQGSGQPLYQIVSVFEQPWNTPSPQPAALELKVDYEPTRLAAGKPIACRVRVRNRGSQEAHYIQVDVGLPPGCELDLAQLQREIPPSIHRFAWENHHLFLTFPQLRPGEEQTVRCRLQTSFPLRVQTLPSRILESYTPSQTAFALPTQITVD